MGIFSTFKATHPLAPSDSEVCSSFIIFQHCKLFALPFPSSDEHLVLMNIPAAFITGPSATLAQVPSLVFLGIIIILGLQKVLYIRCWMNESSDHILKLSESLEPSFFLPASMGWRRINSEVLPAVCFSPLSRKQKYTTGEETEWNTQ